MLIENQSNLNKANLESSSTQKFETVTRKSNKKQSIHKTNEIKCSNRYETLYTDDNDDESCNSYDSSTSSDSSITSDKMFDEISSGNIQKKKIDTAIKEKNEIIKERTDNLDVHKNSYYHQPKASVERMQSTFRSIIMRKRKKMVLFSVFKG